MWVGLAASPSPENGLPVSASLKSQPVTPNEEHKCACFFRPQELVAEATALMGAAVAEALRTVTSGQWEAREQEKDEASNRNAKLLQVARVINRKRKSSPPNDNNTLIVICIYIFGKCGTAASRKTRTS